MKRMADFYASIGHVAILHEFVLAKGKNYKAIKFEGKKQPDRQCYRNAILYAESHDLDYVEGLAMSPHLPLLVEHAWCTDGTNAIDPTWREPEKCMYFGVAFKSSRATSMMLKNGYAGLYQNGHEMINLNFFKKIDPKWWAGIEKRMNMPKTKPNKEIQI